jgi:NAD dependent epimerase/dehydratase family enzyme
MFCKAIQDRSLAGAYNGVAPNPVTNAELTKAIASILKKPLWLPNVPPFVLRLLVGEMADIVVNGSKVSAEKILATRFKFQYWQIDDALRNLLSKN